MAGGEPLEIQARAGKPRVFARVPAVPCRRQEPNQRDTGRPLDCCGEAPAVGGAGRWQHPQARAVSYTHLRAHETSAHL
eukprot:14805773-Alexandrium_andersonii.AAC.1